MWIPLFGWYAGKQQMIPVDRGARGKVMLDVLKRTREVLAKGRQLIITPKAPVVRPEPSRSTNTASPACTRDLGVPVVPVAMHPGPFLAAADLSALPRPFQGTHPALHRSGHGSGRLLCAVDRGNGKKQATSCWSRRSPTIRTFRYLRPRPCDWPRLPPPRSPRLRPDQLGRLAHPLDFIRHLLEPVIPDAELLEMRNVLNT